MIALVFFFLADAPRDLPVRCELMEVNTVMEADGGVAFTQIILWEWSEDYRRYDVTDYMMLHGRQRLPRPYLDRYVVYSERRDCWVESSILFFTQTFKDREHANKKLLDPEHRRDLYQSRRLWRASKRKPWLPIPIPEPTDIP